MHEDVLDTAKRFKKWKKATRGRGTRIPDNFWNEFKELFKKYEDKELYKTLGITKYNWDKNVLGKKVVVAKKKKDSFVLLPTKATVNESNLAPLMKLKLKNGTEITVFQ
jgi:hypothetical protein